MVGPVYRVARATRGDREKLEEPAEAVGAEESRSKEKQNAAIWRKNLVNEEAAGKGIYNDG